MTYKKNIRKLLTTASALGMIAMGAQEASAAATAIGAPTAYSGALNGAADNWANFTSANALTMDVAGVAGGVMAGAYVGVGGGGIVGDISFSIGSISGANTITVNMANAGNVMTLTGTHYGTGVTPATALGGAANNYSGLGAVTLSNNTAGLTITNGVTNQTLANDVLAAGAGNGILVINAGATGNTFTGNMGGANGGNAFASSAVNESVIFKPAAGKTGVNLGATTIAINKTLTIDGTTATGAVAIAGTINSAANVAANTNGALAVIAGAQNITNAGIIGGGVGLGSLSVAIGGAGSFTNGAATTVAGNITVTGTGAGGGAGAANGAVFTGAVTTTAAGNFDASGLTVAPLNFGNAAAVIAGVFKSGGGLFTAANALTVAGAANTNTITIGAGGATITGKTIATNGNILLNNTAGNVATFTGGIVTTAGNNGNVTTGAGAVTIGGGGNPASTIDGTLTTAAGTLTAAGNGLVTVTGNGVAAGNTSFTVGAGGIQFAGGFKASAGNVDLSADTTGSTITGAVTMTQAGSSIKVGAGNTGARATTGLRLGNAVTFTSGGTIDLAGNALTLVAPGAQVIGVTNAGNYANIISSVAGGTLVLGDVALPHLGVIQGNIGATGTTGAIGAIILGGDATRATIGGVGSTTTLVNAGSTTFDGTGGTYGATVNTQLTVDNTANSITYNGTVGAAVGNFGKLILAGVAANTTTFTGTIGAGANTLNLITHNTGNVLFQKTVSAVGAITLNGGTVTFADAVTTTNAANGIIVNDVNTVANFQGNVNGAILGTAAGTVNFGNAPTAATNITVTGDGTGAGVGINGIGGAAALGTVTTNLSGGILALNTGKINTTNFTFKTNDTLTLAAAVTAPALGTVTATTGGQGTINFNQNYTTTGSIGAKSGAGIAAVNMLGNNLTLNVASNHNVYAQITGSSATINVAAGTSNFTNVGTSAAPVSVFSTTVGASNVVATNIYASSITNTGTITLNDQGTLSNVTGAGSVTTTNNATIGNISGGAANFTMNASATSTPGTVTLNGNTIAATAIAQQGNILKLTQNTTMTGAYTVTGTTSAINMNGQTLTITGAPAINAPLTVTFTGATPAPVGAQNVITSSTAPTFTAAGVVTLQFANGYTPADGTVLNMFGNSANAAYANVANANYAFVADPLGRGFVSGVTFNATAGTATVSAKITAASFTDSTDSNTQGAATALAAAKSGDALALQNSFKMMTSAERIEATDDFADHSSDISNGTVAASVVTTAAQVATAAVIGARQEATTHADATGAGVAAGDSAERFGVWAEVIGGTATQKQRKGLSGFQARTFGGIVGVDTMVSDNMSVGMLVSNVNNNVKFKDTNAGDKATANSWIFGAYGNYDIGSTDFFVQGNLTVAQTGVDAKGKKLVATGGVRQTAKAKYDILGVGADLVGGYKHRFENSYVAPTIGLRYNYFGDTSYTGTGLTVGNQTVKTKANSVLSGLAGVKIGADVDMDGTTIRPEAHVNLSYAFNAPSTKTSYKIDGTNSINYAGPKASRFGANFGAGVMADADGFEYGVGYDANISDKYLAHQGSLKLKVKF